MMTRDKELEHSINKLRDEMRNEFRSLKQKIDRSNDGVPPTIPNFKGRDSGRYQHTDGMTLKLIDFVLDKTVLIASVVAGVVIAAKLLNMF